MKKTQLFLVIALFASLPFMSKGQDKSKFQYSIGMGGTIDGNNLLHGINFTNELNYKLGRRTSLNLGLMFYQSLGNLRDYKFAPGQKNIDNSSGIFISPAFKYDIIQRPSSFKLSFSAGPTLQLGGEGYLANINYFNPEVGPEVVSFINSYQRIVIFAELEAEWTTKNPTVRNAASISATGFDEYLRWYFNASYKVRFGLGKK